MDLISTFTFGLNSYLQEGGIRSAAVALLQSCQQCLSGGLEEMGIFVQVLILLICYFLAFCFFCVCALRVTRYFWPYLQNPLFSILRKVVRRFLVNLFSEEFTVSDPSPIIETMIESLVPFVRDPTQFDKETALFLRDNPIPHYKPHSRDVPKLSSCEDCSDCIPWWFVDPVHYDKDSEYGFCVHAKKRIVSHFYTDIDQDVDVEVEEILPHYFVLGKGIRIKRYCGIFDVVREDGLKTILVPHFSSTYYASNQSTYVIRRQLVSQEDGGERGRYNMAQVVPGYGFLSFLISRTLDMAADMGVNDLREVYWFRQRAIKRGGLPERPPKCDRVVVEIDERINEVAEGVSRSDDAPDLNPSPTLTSVCLSDIERGEKGPAQERIIQTLEEIEDVDDGIGIEDHKEYLGIRTEPDLYGDPYRIERNGVETFKLTGFYDGETPLNKMEALDPKMLRDTVWKDGVMKAGRKAYVIKAVGMGAVRPFVNSNDFVGQMCGIHRTFTTVPVASTIVTARIGEDIHTFTRGDYTPDWSKVFGDIDFEAEMQIIGDAIKVIEAHRVEGKLRFNFDDHYSPIDWVKEIEKLCLNFASAKKRRLEQVFDAIKNGLDELLQRNARLKTFIKMDEKDFKGKARPIMFVATYEWLYCAMKINAALLILKYRGDKPRGGWKYTLPTGEKVHFIWASGLTQKELSEEFNRAEDRFKNTGINTVFICGDDNSDAYAACDAAKYDWSQRGDFFSFQCAVIKIMGFTETDLELMCEWHRADLYWESDQAKITQPAGFRLPSGAIWTLFLNTLGDMIFHCFLHRLRAEHKMNSTDEERIEYVDVAAGFCGLEMKKIPNPYLRNPSRSPYEGVEFLKGQTVRCAGTLIWTKSPSCCVKYGWIIANNEHPWTEKKIIQHVKSVALGQKNFINDPLTAAFVEVWADDRVKEVKPDWININEDPTFKLTKKQQECWLKVWEAQMFDRYDISGPELNKMIGLIREFGVSLGNIKGGGFDRLVAVDYRGDLSATISSGGK